MDTRGFSQKDVNDTVKIGNRFDKLSYTPILPVGWARAEHAGFYTDDNKWEMYLPTGEGWTKNVGWFRGNS